MWNQKIKSIFNFWKSSCLAIRVIYFRSSTKRWYIYVNYENWRLKAIYKVSKEQLSSSINFSCIESKRSWIAFFVSQIYDFNHYFPFKADWMVSITYIINILPHFAKCVGKLSILIIKLDLSFNLKCSLEWSINGGQAGPFHYWK